MASSFDRRISPVRAKAFAGFLFFAGMGSPSQTRSGFPLSWK